MAAEFPQTSRRKQPSVWEHLRMNPEDDPEARIRDLERPLADVARASELGTPDYRSGEYLPPPVQAYDAPPTQPYGAYGAPPPMPPPAYGAPYPDMFSGPPQKAKSSSGVLWFLFAGIAVVVVMMVGGVVIWTNMFKLDSATRPPIEIPIPAIELPSDVPGVGPLPEVAIPSVEVPGVPPIPVPGAALSVSGVGKNETLTCNDNVVMVSGVNNTVTITGHCVNLSVSGVDNVVTVDAVDSITASGFDNKVIYLSGSPEIGAGGSNIVEQG
jgi:hypothetical protein